MQVFTRDGKFVKEVFVAAGVARRRLDVGHRVLEGRRSRSTCTWPTAATRSIHIYDRQSLIELTNFGDGGHYPGQFYSLHSIAVDSKGNLYTTETYQGRRVQKFTYKGLGAGDEEGYRARSGRRHRRGELRHLEQRQPRRHEKHEETIFFFVTS